MFKKILVPLDGSALAEKALQHATEVTKAHGASLMLLRAVPLKFYEEPVTEAEQEAIRTIKGRAGTYLADVAERLKKQGIDAKTEVTDGDPAQVILDVARGEECDLIVMTTHGFSGLERFIWGSVTDKVAKASNVPLLLIRPIPITIKAAEAEAAVGV